MRESALRLSIVIPTKNRPKLVESAVRSALDGLPSDAEIIVVDDRSNPPLAQAFAHADPRLRLVESGGTPGASGARNWGVSQAGGARILFLDDDDLLRPGYATWVLAQSGDYGFSAVLPFSGLHHPMQTSFPGATARPVSSLHPFRRKLAGLGCGFWIEKSIFLKLGGIAEDLRVNEDTEFSVKLLSAGLQGSYSAEPGVMIRRHEYGHLTHATNDLQRAGNFATILDRHALWLGQNREARVHLRSRQIKLLAHAGDTTAAAAAIKREPALGDRLRLWLLFGVTRVADRLRRR